MQTTHNTTAPDQTDADTATTGAPAAHDALVAALLGADEPALQALVADRCQIIGPKGFHLGKQEWIRPHVDDVYELVSMDIVDSTTETYGPTTVIVDLQRSECLFNGERIDGLYRVLSTWHQTGEATRWQLVALQYTAVAPEAAGAPV